MFSYACDSFHSLLNSIMWMLTIGVCGIMFGIILFMMTVSDRVFIIEYNENIFKVYYEKQNNS